MEKTQLTAAQLFLLCNLRKGRGVWATNVQDFTTKKLDKEIIEKSKSRCFIIHENGDGFSLDDGHQKTSWYMPQADNENDWNYQGIFELDEPLLRSEKFVLFTFYKVATESFAS